MRAAPLIGLVVCAACVKSGSPTIAPVAEEIIRATPRVTWTAAVQAVTDQGLPLRWTDPETRVIETDYVDITTYRQEASQYPVAERIVRFRVLVGVDPNGQGSRLAIQGIYSPFTTGLSNTRRNERAIPRSHPAMEVVRRMVGRVQELAEGG